MTAESLSPRRKQFAVAAAVTAVAVGLLVLVGWAGGIAVLKSAMPGLATMKANTALSFVLAGVSLWALLGTQQTRPTFIGWACAVGLLAVAILTLGQYTLALDFGIDELLFRDDPESVGVSAPGRMAQATAVAFLLTGTALLLLHTSRASRAAQSLTLLVLVLAGLCCLGYLYGADEFHAFGPFGSVAVHTALTLLVLSVGILTGSPNTGPVGFLARRGAGSELARLLLPAAVALPILIGWARLAGQNAGWYDTEFGLAIFALSNVVAFSSLVYWSASRVQYSEDRREESNDALRRSDQKFRMLLEGVPQLIWTCLPDGQCDYLSRQWVEYTGRSETEQLGYGWLEAVHPDDRALLTERWQRTVAERSPLDVEFRIRNKAGEYRWFQTRAVWYDEETGAGRWFGTNTDIHDKRLAEDRLQSLNATLEQRVAERTLALEKSEQRFRAIFHSQFQFIGLMSTAGVLLEANRAALVSAGVKEESVLGKPFWETVWWAHDPAQQARLREAIHRAAGGQPDRFEASHPTSDGALVWVDFSLTPFRDDSGTVILLIPEGRDITERKRAESELQENRERLEMALSASRMGVWEWDVATGAVYWSEKCHEITGNAPFDSTLQAFTRIIHPEDKDRVWEAVQTALATRAEYASEFRVIAPDGNERWLSNIGRATYSASGTATRMVGLVQDITARVRAEADLRVSEERFRSAFEFAPIGLALVSLEGRWLRVNRSLCEIVGYSEAELLVTDFQAITHPDDLDADLVHVREMLEGAIQTYQMEKRYFHKRGHVVHVLLAASLVRDAGGKPLYFVSQIKDITQRKEAEKALAANEALLRQFIKYSPAAIAMFDRDLRYIQASDRWLIDYHLGERDIIGRSHYEVFPDIPDHWKAIHQRVLAGVVERCDEDPFQRADGSTEWLQWECRPWLRADGEIGGLIMFTQVITPRKLAEVSLRASEERFRVLFERSSDAHLIFDENDGIIDCNNAAIILLRCQNKREVLALHPAALSPEFQPDGRRSLEKCIEMDATARRNGYHRFDWLHRRLDGEVFPCEVTLTPVELHGRSVLLVVWHDLTERKLAEDRVKASLREKEVLLKEIHHRVKNNLQIVSTLLDLQSDHTDNMQAQEMFQESRGRVKSMALIHERLYRSEDMARVNFTDYVRQLADDLYHTYKVSNDIQLELNVDIPPLPIDIAIPCGLLLNELMSNCFKHAFKDDTPGYIRVSLTADADGTNVLVVSDNGPGFPSNIDFRNTASFGMQLVVTLVDQLDGEIELISDPGTTFTVRFANAKM